MKRYCPLTSRISVGRSKLGRGAYPIVQFSAQQPE